MKVAAETHLFGSIEGYTTLAASAGIRGEDLGPLEALGFGQPSARGAGRLLEEPVVLAQPIGRRWMAITRALPGPPDTAGRETVQRLSLVLRHRDYRSIVRGDLRAFLVDHRLWKPAHFAIGRRINIPIANPAPDAAVPSESALRVLQAWSIARRSESMGVFPLGAESAILDLLRSLHANDLPLLRWGLRLLSTGATADVATLLIDDEMATRKPIRRASVNDALELPSIRRFDGISKPLPAMFGEEPPEEPDEDAAERGPDPDDRRSGPSRKTIGILAGTGAAIAAALGLTWALLRSPPERDSASEPAVSPEGIPESMAEAMDADAGREETAVPPPEPSSEIDTPSLASSADPDPVPEAPVGSPNEDGTVPPDEPPAVVATPAPVMALDVALDEVAQYRGNRPPDRLESKTEEHVRDFFGAIASIEHHHQKMIRDFAGLSRRESVVATGIIPDDFRNTEREQRRFIEALETVPIASQTIRRSRRGLPVIVDFLGESAHTRAVLGIADPPPPGSRASDRKRWTDAAFQRIDDWSGELLATLGAGMARTLTEVADSVRNATADGVSILHFAAEARALLVQVKRTPETLPGVAAVDLSSALDRLRAGQAGLKDGNVDGWPAMIQDATRVLSLVGWCVEDHVVACDLIRSRFEGFKPEQRLGDEGERFAESISDLLAALPDLGLTSLREVGSALTRLMNEERKDRISPDPRLEEALASFDRELVSLRKRCPPRSQYKSRRGADSILADLKNMANDIQAIEWGLANCFESPLDQLRQDLFSSLEDAKRSEPGRSGRYDGIHKKIDAGISRLCVKIAPRRG